jgi:hypothetical protein
MYTRRKAKHIHKTTIFSSERMLHKDYDRMDSTAKKISGRDPQGACRQDELTDGKPPVVK